MARTETQDQILDAVQSVIVRDGVRGASMRQVAQEADVSLGLLSYHFDDKDSLILAAFVRAASDILQTCTAAAEAVEDPADRVRAFLRGAFTDDFLDGDYLRLRVSLWAVALTDLNRDGILDAVVSQSTSVQVLRGNGSGFAAALAGDLIATGGTL